MSDIKLSVLVPTWNNADQLIRMVNSMTRIGFFERGDRELIIVNNGKQPCVSDFAHIIAKRTLQVINCADNRGWEGGLIEGLKVAKGEYVCFQNDDVHIPQNGVTFYDDLMSVDCGMVCPISTTAAGIQSIYHQNTPTHLTEVRWLIFLCVMMKRRVLEEVGGVDETLPGGDDIDLSIRMRQAGYKLYVNPQAFLVHHGFQTGNRVNGDHTVDGGWNSQKMQERTTHALINKHGFRNWFETVKDQIA